MSASAKEDAGLPWRSLRESAGDADGLGELAGWFVGSGGWRAQYAQERFNDYTKDLKLEL